MVRKPRVYRYTDVGEEPVVDQFMADVYEYIRIRDIMNTEAAAGIIATKSRAEHINLLTTTINNHLRARY